MIGPHSRQLNRGLLPEGLEADRFFGPNLAARVVYDKQTQHLSYERIVATRRDLYGVSLSEGGIAAILRRAGECAKPVAKQIKERVIADQIIKSDESSAPVRGRNWWPGSFVGSSGVYHHIGPTRSATQIRAVLGDRMVESGGAKAYAAWQSVIATVRLRGENIFDVLVKLMGKSIDRYLQPSSP